MDAPNPYRPPSAPSDPVDLAKSPAPMEDSIGFDFRADWSTQGLRERRRSPRHRWGDFAFFVLLFGLIASVAAAILTSSSVGLVCLFAPLVSMASILWLSNWVYRRGGSFHIKGEPLSGAIRGRVDDGIISFRGPAMSLATPVRHCQHSKWTTRGAVFRPPLVPELLPISETDIGDTWATTVVDPDQDMLVARTIRESDRETSAETIGGGGMLLGTDFRGQRRWQFWNRVGPALALTGGLIVVVCIVAWMTLPTWVRHPPSHYARSAAEQRTMWYLMLGAIFAIGLSGIGLWLWSRCRASFGIYRVAFFHDTVVIAGGTFAAGYFGKSLANFSAGDAGLQVFQPNGQLAFLIPYRWFESDDRPRIDAWLSRHPEVSETPTMRFLGPEFGTRPVN